MLSELPDFSLSRKIPDKVILGVLSGTYKVFGGVIRDNSGKIVAHLINTSNPAKIASTFLSPLSTAVSGVNTFQLFKIGKDITKLMTMSQATMAISGLTLAVSAASFYFLNKKMNKITEELETLSADIKYIRTFLETQERAKIVSAFKEVKDIVDVEDPELQISMMLNSRKTLGEIHERYKALLTDEKNVKELILIEEYFTLTALGYSLCSAELGLHDQAVRELQESLSIWRTSTKQFIRERVLGEQPQRLLNKKYVPYVKSDEIVAWMNYVDDSELEFERLDELRDRKPIIDINVFNSIDAEEALCLNVTRKLIERERILEGYVSQYEYFASERLKPSEVNTYIETLKVKTTEDECLVLIKNDLIE